MENNIIRRVVLLGAITIIGIIGIQSYWVVRTWDIKEQDFNQTVKIALLNVAKDLESLSGRNSLPAKGLISQQSSNTYLVNINDEINADMLEYYLQKELEERALNTDFEYGIYDCESKDMVYGRYIDYAKDKNKQGEAPNKEIELPTNGEFEYYFSVRFPNRTSHILEDMRLAIFFSLILLLSVFFFIYSMFIILRQKRLSEMQKDFINNMTHEFKTPISTIKISADVFLNNPQIQGNDRLHRYAQIIKDQNQRLNNQVEKVLQLAKIERGGFVLRRPSIHNGVGGVGVKFSCLPVDHCYRRWTFSRCVGIDCQRDRRGRRSRKAAFDSPKPFIGNPIVTSACRDWILGGAVVVWCIGGVGRISDVGNQLYESDLCGFDVLYPQ